MVSCFGEFETTYYHSAYILVSNPNQYPYKNSFSQVKRGGGATLLFFILTKQNFSYVSVNFLVWVYLFINWSEYPLVLSHFHFSY